MHLNLVNDVFQVKKSFFAYLRFSNLKVYQTFDTKIKGNIPF